MADITVWEQRVRCNMLVFSRVPSVLGKEAGDSRVGMSRCAIDRLRESTRRCTESLEAVNQSSFILECTKINPPVSARNVPM